MINPQDSNPTYPATKAESTIRDWVTVEQFCSLLPNIPEKAVKWQLTCRHKNGLGTHIRLIGKQRFISISGYASWLAGDIDSRTSHQQRVT